ncbi:MAG: hypothetical protein HY532_01700 [Chloroflexi bacterium]|nr:hypothetical protein [Chloroflexota bacterium]
MASSGYHNGTIDDARIYNRVLTPGEIQGLAVRPSVHYVNLLAFTPCSASAWLLPGY